MPVKVAKGQKTQKTVTQNKSVDLQDDEQTIRSESHLPTASNSGSFNSRTSRLRRNNANEASDLSDEEAYRNTFEGNLCYIL